MNIFYAVVRFLVLLYYKVLYFVSVEGKDNIPKSGGFILCPNHKSNNDPPFIAVALPRQLRFLAKKELFKNKFASFFLKSVGAISLNRSATDVGAIKQCMSVLRKEYGLLIFPQGKRAKELKEKDFHGGALLIAQRLNVPVIPAYISGEYKPFHKVKLIVGEPISAKLLDKIVTVNEDKASKTNELIYKSINALKKD